MGVCALEVHYTAIHWPAISRVPYREGTQGRSRADPRHAKSVYGGKPQEIIIDCLEVLQHIQSSLDISILSPLSLTRRTPLRISTPPDVPHQKMVISEEEIHLAFTINSIYDYAGCRAASGVLENV